MLVGVSVVRVVVAEDSIVVRQGVIRLLAAAPDLDTVAWCTDLPGLLAAVDEHEPDVVVTDIRMPPTGTDEGITAAQTLRTTRPHAGVVVLSQHDEPEYALRLLEHGSARRAYLLKDSLAEPDELAGAVRRVAAGGSVVDPVVVEGLVRARMDRPRSSLAALTPREREVLSQMAQGHSNDGIARALHITAKVVEKHINALFAKLGLADEPDTNRRVKAVLIHLAHGGTDHARR